MQGEPLHPSIHIGHGALQQSCTQLAQSHPKILVLTDTNTARDCLPILTPHLPQHFHHALPAGESSKDIAHCIHIWEVLTAHRFERGDLLMNLGGGMVCDIGGFAASCYKRGMAFVHIPTTLLAMADAAVGGKTGINFQGFKNQVGTFQHPKAIVIHTPFLETLPPRERLSGYAEVLKHYLIRDRAAWEAAAAQPRLPEDWDAMVPAAVRIKQYFTEQDPHEKGIRKALNFGHTVGHAIESHWMQAHPEDTLLHGEAVAAGMACEAWLSLQHGLLSQAEFQSIRDTLYSVFPQARFSTDEIPAMSRWCLQDKKNQDGRINATLLDGIGNYALDQPLTLAEIEGALLAYHHAFAP